MDDEHECDIQAEVLDLFYQSGRFEGALNSLTGVIELLELHEKREVEPEFIIDALKTAVANRMVYLDHLVTNCRNKIENGD